MLRASGSSGATETSRHTAAARTVIPSAVIPAANDIRKPTYRASQISAWVSVTAARAQVLLLPALNLATSIRSIDAGVVHSLHAALWTRNDCGDSSCVVRGERYHGTQSLRGRLEALEPINAHQVTNEFADVTMGISAGISSRNLEHEFAQDSSSVWQGPHL